MKSHILSSAQEYEEQSVFKSETRPVFHLTPRIGWMNDPNGFSQYKGQYHLFYQYYPYNKRWGPMHWGHAVSKDLLRWEYLPCAIAPDTVPDAGGCFSGSAVTLDDGRHLLLYTGVIRINDMDDTSFVQEQCVAAGDGLDYEKYEGNPVINEDSLPQGTSRFDFRDPKIWKEADGTYRCVAVTCSRDGERKGRVLYYSSKDGFSWKYISTLIENDGSLGSMWECPDFFELDGKYLLLVSPQDQIENDEYFCGNITVWMSGEFDRENSVFLKEKVQLADYGIDFYATQTLLADDGRRIMVAWMQNWDSTTFDGGPDFEWIGQMTIPRELSFRDGKLIQTPVRELEQYRFDPVVIKDYPVSGKTHIDGIKGRLLDLTLDIRPGKENSFRKFEIRFAESSETYFSLVYRAYESTIEYDRAHSGTRRAVIHNRKFNVPDNGGKIRLRMILDKYSCEVFINDGEQTISNVFFTDINADGISFKAEGTALLDIEKYDLFAE